MMTDEELAKARKGLPIDVAPDGTPLDLTASLMSEAVVQLTRIANNTAKPEAHVNARDIAEAWDAVGMRIYPEKAAEFLKRLGIVIDE